MKSRKVTKINSLLFAIFIVSMMCVATVSATENNKKLDSGKITLIKGEDVIEIVDSKYTLDDKEDRDVQTFSPSNDLISSPSSGLTASESSGFSWQASSDVYRYLGVGSPRFLTYSRSRLDGSAYDIDEIGVRGRLWRDGALQLDETDTNYNSADAGVYWSFSDTGGSYYAGTWDCRGNHVFEEENSYWYPITEDSITVGI